MSYATVAALFVRADGNYKAMPGVDAWDMERDARLWPGGCPVVAHPPCLIDLDERSVSMARERIASDAPLFASMEAA